MGVSNYIKRLRIVTIASNLKHYFKLRENRVFYQKYAIKKKFWQLLSYNAITKHSDDLPWLDDSQVTQDLKLSPRFRQFPEDFQQQLLLWKEKGFLSLPAFFSKEKVEATEQSILGGLSKEQKKQYYSNRLLNQHRSNEHLNALCKDKRLLKILSSILGKEVAPFQSTVFHKSGSQLAHSDSAHLTTEPLGYLIGVWIALEDVQPGSGEFFYYPGSHRLPYILNKDFDNKSNFWKLDPKIYTKYEDRVAALIEENKLVAEDYLPRKGDIMIWHANLLHGSRPKANPELTRKSLIVHYFALGVLCYHALLEKPAVFHP